MATIGLFVIAVLVVMLGLLIAAARFHSLDTIVVRTSWVPAAALLLQWAFRDPLVGAMSYFVVLLPILTLVVSLVITIVGLTIILSGQVDKARTRTVSVCTAVAFAPFMLLVVIILLESSR